MLITSLILALSSFLVAGPLYRFAIQFAHRFHLLDHPSPRRRHRAPTPIIGGLCIFATWFIGMGVLAVMYPDWISMVKATLLPLSISLLILIALGVVDDVKGLNPFPKLIFQVLAAAIVLEFEPNVHAFGVSWMPTFGIAIWPLMFIWIIGVTNAINLIDGLDGLAGGTSMLIFVTLSVLSVFGGNGSGFQGISTILLTGAILGFLRFNWNPAKLFLGDNGSLPLGFLISVFSLTSHSGGSSSWGFLFSVILMVGYPILDMGLAVWRRFHHHLPLFKADRNHLHFRIQRIGLSTRETATFLLSISLFFQAAALCMNLLDGFSAILCTSMLCFGVLSVLYFASCVEQKQIQKIKEKGDLPFQKRFNDVAKKNQIVVEVLLAPIFEVGLFEEESRMDQIVKSLLSDLKSTSSKDEEIILTENSIQILLSADDSASHEFTKKRIRQKYEAKLERFCSLMELQCSLSNIPVDIKRAS